MAWRRLSLRGSFWCGRRALLLALAMAALLAPCAPPAERDAQYAAIADGWGEARYATAGDDRQRSALHLLEVEATALARACPQDPRSRVWLGVIYASQADDADWYAALGLADQARSLLRGVESATLDDESRVILECTLGALYGQAPPAPISFGDARRAEHYFQQALARDPQGLEPNFLYADFLMRQHRYGEARRALIVALAASVRPGRESGDQGMQHEAADLLVVARHNDTGAQ